MEIFYYCDKCGFISDSKEEMCWCCGNTNYVKIPERYGVLHWNLDDWDNRDAIDEEVIKKSPNFDQYLFEHRNEIIKLKNDDMDAIMAHGRAVLEERDKGNRFNVKCPYCNDTNVKKISGISKGISAGLFGVFALGKISKQWHCNNCGSDF